MKKTIHVAAQAMLVCLGVFVCTAAANAQQCPGLPSLKIDEHTLDFSENKPVCVRPNGTFRIRLKPQNGYPLDYDDVTVRQKAGPTRIKKKKIDAQGVMTVTVGNFTVGTEPQYKITVAGVGVLDPRVRIIPTYLALQSNYGEIEDYLLAQYGLSLSGLKDMDQYLRDEYHTDVTEILRNIPATESAD
jgi:hypothetical protein